MTTTRAEIIDKREKAREQQLALIAAKVPDAYAWLEAECLAHIDEIIQPEQMAEARKRLEWELKMIQEHRLAVIFLHLREYMEKAGITADEVLHRGSLPCSVVSYLLGLTNLNPITYGLPTELFYGRYKNGAFVYKLPAIEFAVSYKVREKSIDILKHLPGVGEAMEVGWQHQHWIAFLPQEHAPEIGPAFRKENGNLCAVFYQEAREKCWYWFLNADDRLEHLSLLYERTSVRPENIGLDDQGVLTYLRENNIYMKEPLCFADLRLETLGLGLGGTNFDSGKDYSDEYQEMVEMLKPASFTDFAKIEGLFHGEGAWSEKIQSMVKAGELTIKNIFATREDVKEYFEAKGVPPEKVCNMPFLSRDKEKLVAVSQQADIDEWCRESCQEIKSLFPRAGVLSRALVYWRLAYFRHYYPEIFYETLFLSKQMPSGSYRYGAYEPA